MALQLSPRASDVLVNDAKLKQVKVLICTETCTLSGYTYCMNRQRLLDVLNQSLIANSMSMGKDFVLLTNVEVFSPNRGKELIASVSVRKSNILFVGEESECQPEISEIKDRPNVYPVREKTPMAAEIRMPSYIIKGQMYAEMWQQMLDVVDRADKFLPLTNVEIYPMLDNTVLTFDFVAVNRDKIIYACESSAPTEATLWQKNLS